MSVQKLCNHLSNIYFFSIFYAIIGIQVNFCVPVCGHADGDAVIRHLILCWAGDHNDQCEVGKFIKCGKSGCRRCKTMSRCIHFSHKLLCACFQCSRQEWVSGQKFDKVSYLTWKNNKKLYLHHVSCINIHVCNCTFVVYFTLFNFHVFFLLSKPVLQLPI